MVIDELVAAREVIASLLARPAYGFTDAELLAIFDQATSHLVALQALQALMLGEIDARGLSRADGSTSTAVWMRERHRVSNKTAAASAGLAAALARLPHLAQALSDGAVNAEQAQVIAKAIDDLPADTPIAIKEEAEQLLIDLAQTHGPQALRTLGAHILHRIDPGAAERRDADALERAERRAAQTRGLTLTPDALGRVRLLGWLSSEDAAYITAAIEPLCKPAGPDDSRTPTQRRADGLVDVCKFALATEELPEKGGDSAKVVFTMDFEQFRAHLGTGMLDNGESVTAQTMRRIACNAGIVPALLGGHSVPIDLGQERRLYTGAARRALVLRDGGCAFPGCDRPPKWCEGHHRIPWHLGGRTDLDNGVLLCGYHHRLIHEGDWEIRLGADRRPDFIPPAWIDPQRRPRRNHHHHRHHDHRRC